jgi:hypothetical protein
MTPMSGWRRRVCGNEYYDAFELGGEMQFCAIDDSNGAIGRCAIDYRMVCGYHSDMRDGRRLCSDCIAEADAASAQKEALDAFDSLRHGMDQLRSVCSSLAVVHDPADRFIVLMLLAQRLRREVLGSGTPGYALAAEEARRILVASADAVLGRRTMPMWDAGSEQPGSWTFNAAALVSAWLEKGRLQYGAAVSLRVIAYKQTSSRRLKPVKQGNVSGWKIANGNRGSYGPGSYGDSGERPDLYLLQDGTIGRVSCGERELHPEMGGADRTPLDMNHLPLVFEAQPATWPRLPGPVAGIFDGLLLNFQPGNGWAAF